MAEDLKLRLEELTENPTARVPVCLALDISGSMGGGQKIDELNAAIGAFFRAVREDEMAAIAAEIAVVTFGDQVTKVLDFAGIDRQTIPVLRPSGSTPMGTAVNMALDILEQAKRVYSRMGVDYFQPWLVLMTDGQPTDDIARAVQRCRELALQRPQKLTIFPIAIGNDANLSVLSQFSPTLNPLRIQASDFRRLFQWLAKSVNAVSLSNPGDTESTSFGENAFKKMSMDWHTAITKR